MIVFSLLEKEHLDSLAELERLCFSKPWGGDVLADELDSSISTFIVACDGDKVVGYVGFWKVIDEGQIVTVAVHPEYRRRGIAGQLLEHMFEQAKALQLSHFTLEVRESNQPAICLYRAKGFETVGRREGYYENPSEAAVLMTKWLHVAE